MLNFASAQDQITITGSQNLKFITYTKLLQSQQTIHSTHKKKIHIMTYKLCLLHFRSNYQLII